MIQRGPRTGRWLLALACLSCGPVLAAEDAAAVDVAAQAVKRRALELNRDLLVLEEQTLFPVAQQLAVFVTADLGLFFKPDTVKLSLDGRPLVQHGYTEPQTAALVEGAAQKLYVGRVAAGAHELLAVFTGRTAQGHLWRRAVVLNFEKPATAQRIVQVHVGDSEGRQEPQFSARVWP